MELGLVVIYDDNSILNYPVDFSRFLNFKILMIQTISLPSLKSIFRNTFHTNTFRENGILSFYSRVL